MCRRFRENLHQLILHHLKVNQKSQGRGWPKNSLNYLGNPLLLLLGLGFFSCSPLTKKKKIDKLINDRLSLSIQILLLNTAEHFSQSVFFSQTLKQCRYKTSSLKNAHKQQEKLIHEKNTVHQVPCKDLCSMNNEFYF